MAGGKQKKKKTSAKQKPEKSLLSNFSAPARNMRKADLGAVIFGCKHSTIDECLLKQLFGLPIQHYPYIKNITKGLVLFLFNMSDRKLHGIFEAASPGQLNINKYAWLTDEDGCDLTPFPAQVRIQVRQQCMPLPEDQFGPIIADNYYGHNLFYFELDHDQTNKLIRLFSSSPVKATASSSQNTRRWNNLFNSSTVPGKIQKGNGIPNSKPEACFDLVDQASENKSSWPAVSADVSVENPKHSSKLSYASIVGNISTNATAVAASTSTTSSLPVEKWSSLFKTEPAPDAIGEDEKCRKMDEVCARNYGGGFDDFPLNQAIEDKVDVKQANTWEESHFTTTSKDKVECVESWASDLSLRHSDKSPSSPCFDTQSYSSEVSLSDVANDIYNNLTMEEPVDDNLNHELPCPSTQTNKHNVVENHDKSSSASVVNMVTVMNSSDLESLVVKLMQAVEWLRESQSKHIWKTNTLEHELIESKIEIQQLKNQLTVMESRLVSRVDPTEVDDRQLSISHSVFDDSVLIVGGYDGSSWLSTLESYFPSHDAKRSLSPMTTTRKYGLAAPFNDELYFFGGIGSNSVESFIPANNQWISRPPLFYKNGRIAGASLKDMLFAVGGGNGIQCSSEVEYLDLNVGKWIPTQSMQSKRLAPAAAELNNALYVVGGYDYDGSSYLSSVERFDPREGVWSEVKSMNMKKGCHSLVVLNEKLFTLGGYDGHKFLPDVEVFDPRLDSWMIGEPMNVARGNFGAFVLGGKLYAMGGSKEKNEVLDVIECFKEGCGWEVMDLKTVGRRSHFSAIVL